jgi:hypothetical protein
VKKKPGLDLARRDRAPDPLLFLDAADLARGQHPVGRRGHALPAPESLLRRFACGPLPFWTPYIFSGYPLLAYPETGAWYPLNWPSFCSASRWLLIRQLIGSRMAALFGAIAYGLLGFFAGHSSHVGIFCVAAGMPWLLLCFRRAMEGAALRYVGFGGLIGGAILLAGHFQTALYAFAALGLLALAESVRAPRR